MFNLFLKPGKEKSLQRRHPWVYASAVAHFRQQPGSHAENSEPLAGETVSVRASDGRFLAWGAYSPASQIRARLWLFDETQTIDAAWIKKQVHQAVLRRQPLQVRTNAMRLVFGEADGLPGFIADRYADQLVVQFLAVSAEAWRETLIDAVVQATGINNVYERSDANVREREGLKARTGVLRGHEPQAIIDIIEDGVCYGVDVFKGHKTGFYLDQRNGRQRIAQLVSSLLKTRGLSTPATMAPSTSSLEHTDGKYSKQSSVNRIDLNVNDDSKYQATAYLQGITAGKDHSADTSDTNLLNCFSYSGGFSLAALCAGIGHSVSVDSSPQAIALAQDNAQKNQIETQRTEWLEADVFTTLKQLIEQGRQFDIVVLDPPKFAPSAHHVDKAARAYKEINLKAMQLVKPGGWLLTYSCSGVISIELFQKIVAAAVFDANIEYLLIERLSAGEDHPMRMTHPEGEYLKGLLLQRVVMPHHS